MAILEQFINHYTLIELIKIAPSLLWFTLTIIVLKIFYKPICNELLPKIASFEAGGIKLSFIRDSLDAAIHLAEKSPQWEVKISPEDKERAVNRAKKNRVVFQGTKFLWVDDCPENNINERQMFHQLGVEIDIAKSTQEALKILEKMQYDFIISDIARGEDDTAGLDFLTELRKKDKLTPVIFYIGEIDETKGTPAQAFGLTNLPSELLHLVLDLLERKKS